MFQQRAFALGGASPGRSGALNSLLTLRQVLSIGCRALVVPEQLAIPNAAEAFNDKDELVDARTAGQLKMVVKKLIDYARLFGG
jgi:NAD(P)H-dependent FMN reductase